MLHHEYPPEKPQYNMATSPFLDKPGHFALPLPFSSKNFQAPFSSVLKKLNLHKGGGGQNMKSTKAFIVSLKLFRKTLQVICALQES